MAAWFRSYLLLIRWTAIRLKYVVPLMLIVQSFLAVGIVAGFAFLIPTIDQESALYLSTGAPTISLIVVGMVLAPQLVADAKRDGTFEFSRTLPVSRLAIVAADVTTWLLTGLPGVILSMLVSVSRFDLSLDVSILVVPAVLLVALTTISIGYAMAYAMPPNVTGQVSQIIVFVALMFSPVDFPADRLPEWAQSVHSVLPVQYMAEVIRETAVTPAQGIDARPFVVLCLWFVACLAVTIRIMGRRR